LNELNLEKLEITTRDCCGDFQIEENNLLSVINLNNFYKSRRNDGYLSGDLKIIKNSNLKTISFGTELDLEARIVISGNQLLEEIVFTKLINVVSGEISITNNETLKSVSFNSLVSSDFVKDNC
jgi:hypothetical protein